MYFFLFSSYQSQPFQKKQWPIQHRSVTVTHGIAKLIGPLYVHIDLSSLENKKCWITFPRFSTDSIQDLFVIPSDSIPVKNDGIFTAIVVLTFEVSMESFTLVWTMLRYFYFLKNSPESHSNELSCKHFPTEVELLKALGNCQLNEHDELSSSSCTLATSNFLGSISHCPGSKMWHCPLSEEFEPNWNVSKMPLNLFQRGF